MSDETTPKTAEDFRDMVRSYLRPGFTTLEDLHWAVEGDHGEFGLTEQQAHDMVDGEWNARLREEESWTQPSDYDRLRAAFDDLERWHIVARMAFTCCGTCGHSEIVDEWQADTIGYVFFHRQTAANLDATPTDIYFQFGVAEDDEGSPATDALSIAHALQDCLAAHSIEFRGTDSPATCPVATIKDWCKPLPR